jgi:hypothetical protein
VQSRTGKVITLSQASAWLEFAIRGSTNEKGKRNSSNALLYLIYPFGVKAKKGENF